MSDVLSVVTGISFENEFEEEIDKKQYKKMRKWLEKQVFQAKRCIKKIQQMCEVYFESEKTSYGHEQFYISIRQGSDGLDFSLKKRITAKNAVNERTSEISKGQFANFVSGDFDEISENCDDLVFEFCQKAKVQQLKATYACHFEREEYIFRKSDVLLTIDKDMEKNALSGNDNLPENKKNYRVRLKNFGRENEFNYIRNKLITEGA